MHVAQNGGNVKPDYLKTTFKESTSNEEMGLDNPQNIKLKQNYPNPFNPSTTISFSLDKPANIHLIIYSADGTEIASLVNGYQTEGKHSVVWNGTDANGIEVSSGIYFYTLKTDKKAVTKKMLLLR
jgi:flagellar hook assembly protein FlgD